jgi:hypothetical protein
MPARKKTAKSKQGKKSRAAEIKRRKKAKAAGTRFELKVRNELEKEGWIVDKWTNNVNLEEGKLVKVKNKFLGPGKPIMLGAGFPDLIKFKPSKSRRYNIIGVEVRTIGNLSKEEKEKCKFLLDKKIFSRILIAKKGKKRGGIEYIDFKDKYNNL